MDECGKSPARVTVNRVVMWRRRLRSARRRLWVVVAVFAGVLVCSGPAMALGQRGHVFCETCTLAGAQAGDGQVSDPGGVAVSEAGGASGDVFVLDRGNSRIDRFDAEGRFVSAWGYGVNKEGKAGKYEVCDSECKAGVSGGKKYQFSPSVLAISVDNCRNGKGEVCSTTEDPSVGDVYVAATFEHEEEEYEAIDKFTPEGEPIEASHIVKYVQEEGQKRSEAESEELLAEETHGLAVAPDGTVWLYYEEELYGLSDVRLTEATVKQKPLSLSLGGEPAAGLAADASGDFYVAQHLNGSEGTRNVVSKWATVEKEAHEPALENLAEEVDGQATSAVAVDAERGDVYLDHTTSVAAFTQSAALIERFGEGDFEDSGGVAVNAQSRVVYASDPAGDRIDVFVPEPPGSPRVDDVSAQDVTGESAQVDAQIDPDGAKTSFYVEYGPAKVSCVSEPAACTRLSAEALSEGPDEGFGDVPVSVTLEAAKAARLEPHTTYRYRVVAHNAETPSGGDAGESREGSFTTLPVTGPFTADGREWELVSPAEKEGGSVEPITQANGLSQAAANGSAITYVMDGPFGRPEGSRSLEPTQVISSRGRSGWSSQDIATPNQHGIGVELDYTEYQAFSSDLSVGLVEPYLGVRRFAEPPLSPALPGEEKQEKTIYLRNDAPVTPTAPPREATETEKQLAGEEHAIYLRAGEDGEVMSNPGYVALVNGANVLPGQAFGPEIREGGEEQSVHFVSATPDLTHVVIRSTLAALTAGSAKGHNLYEWEGAGNPAQGALHLINVLPGEEEKAATGAELGGTFTGGAGLNIRHAISQDGSRVFWCGFCGTSKAHLYMRDISARDFKGESVQLDSVQPGAEGTGSEEAYPDRPVFQTASGDGSQVFFTDEERLTVGSGALRGKPDLYEFDLDSDTLTDLTPPVKGESAAVRGLVLGAGEDGTSVFFVANGVLSSGARAENAEQTEHAVPGGCEANGEATPPLDATCNLYVEHYDTQTSVWEEPQFIAVLSNEDQPDWEGPKLGADLGEITSQVSPSGSYLAFMSDRSLSSFEGHRYDNRASALGAEGTPAEEVYVYDAQSNAVVCASCDPSGARPTGVYDPAGSGINPEGLGLLVDRPKTWEGKWLAGSVPGWTKIHGDYAQYQSRYLSNNGRLIFDSPDALVSADTNGKEDVYEYEPAGVPRGKHECTSQSATFSARAAGCVGLISSGTSTHESAFLDASVSGGEGPEGKELSEGAGDVFFVTAEKLVPQDADSAFDVYDAHECTTSSPCIPPARTETPAQCEASSSCRPYTPAPPSAPQAPASAARGPSGNLTPKQTVLSNTTSKKPKPLTRAQKLARELASCRAHHKHSKAKRQACERLARRRYGPEHAAPKARKASPDKKTKARSR